MANANADPAVRLIQLPLPAGLAPADELAAGLRAEPAHIAPKFFYDHLGSALFTAITELDEYYPTRTEAGIFQVHAADMAAELGRGGTLVDLGAGNCRKAASLFGAFAPRRYVAVDISADYVGEALERLAPQHPAIEMWGVGHDFSRGPERPAALGDDAWTMFYPGSSVGNFTPAEALAFLRQARTAARGGGLLIGVDLVKPLPVLEAAYDDALGVTAAFNLNLLRHVNRLLGSDFDVAAWRHVALFNPAESRIEMHLEARRSQRVAWPGGERRFAAGERIHTENSYKYSVDSFGALLRDAGFTRLRHWTDPRGWFAVFAAR